MNNLRKTPVLQLKRSCWPLTLYLLGEQVVHEKHVLGHSAINSIIKSGQKDTETSIPPGEG